MSSEETFDNVKDWFVEVVSAKDDEQVRIAGRFTAWSAQNPGSMQEYIRLERAWHRLEGARLIAACISRPDAFLNTTTVIDGHAVAITEFGVFIQERREGGEGETVGLRLGAARQIGQWLVENLREINTDDNPRRST